MDEKLDEKLPAERGEIRPEISDLIEADGWLPLSAANADPGDDDEQRPETD